MHPALLFIDIPEKTPASIVDPLKRSFALYWGNPQACAGSIRTTIEAIADNLQSRRINAKGKPVSFGIHLQDLKLAHPQLVEAAEVIKNKLGNPGAHGDPVERGNLLTAYALLEVELRSLFM